MPTNAADQWAFAPVPWLSGQKLLGRGLHSNPKESQECRDAQCTLLHASNAFGKGDWRQAVVGTVAWFGTEKNGKRAKVMRTENPRVAPEKEERKSLKKQIVTAWKERGRQSTVEALELKRQRRLAALTADELEEKCEENYDCEDCTCPFWHVCGQGPQSAGGTCKKGSFMDDCEEYIRGKLRTVNTKGNVPTRGKLCEPCMQYKAVKNHEQTERLGYHPSSASSHYVTAERKKKNRQSHRRNSLGRASPTANPLPFIQNAYASLSQDNIFKALRQSTEEKSTVRAAVLDLEFVQLPSSADVVVLEAAMVHFLDASRVLLNQKVNPLPEGHATGLQNFLNSIAPKQSANRQFPPQEAFQRVHGAEDAEWDDAAYTSLCVTLPCRKTIEKEIVGLIRRERITHIIHHRGPEPAFVRSLGVSVELLDSQHVYRLINSCHSGAGPKVPEAIFGRELEGAHLALNDVQATAECLHAVLQQFEKVHQKC